MDYVRYLKSKETVDDRSLSEQVLARLDKAVRAHGDAHDELHVLEVGGGVGSMCKRLMKRGTFSACTTVHYTLLDVKQNVLQAAVDNLTCSNTTSTSTPAAKNDANETLSHDYHHVESNREIRLKPVTIAINDGRTEVKVSFVKCDAIEYCCRPANQRRFNMVIGCAVLDLWNVEQCLPILLSVLVPGKTETETETEMETGRGQMSVYYFPINFDGVTDLFPDGVEQVFDERVQASFHSAMGSYNSSIFPGICIRKAHTGRRLPAILHKLGYKHNVVHASSWVIQPPYTPDEQYFLSCIVHFIEHSQCAEEEGDMERYVKVRKDQIERQELFYVAHNVDVLGVGGS